MKVEDFWKKTQGIGGFSTKFWDFSLYPDSHPVKRNSKKTTEKVVPSLINKPIVPMSAL